DVDKIRAPRFGGGPFSLLQDSSSPRPKSRGRQRRRRYDVAFWAVPDSGCAASGMTGVWSALRQVLEGRHHLLINLALEGHDQVGGLLERAPAPGVELRLAVGFQIELCVLAGEAEGEPDLLLALEALPRLGSAHPLGEVIDDPAPGAAQQFDRTDAGLFL